MSDKDTGAAAAEMTFSHVPVMLNEVIGALNIKPDGIYVDGTAGGAGHSSAIAARLETGKLIAIDQDWDAVKTASERLSVFGDRAQVVHSNFCEMKRVCAELGIERIDGFLLDLGVSSYQLDTPERGFSYLADAPLSMKMDATSSFSAYDVVNGYDKEELCRILWEYGEEKFAKRIADGIVRAREKAPVESTLQLAAIIKDALPDGGKSQNHHPCMRTFQAIRIEVNREMDVIPPALRDAVALLGQGGRGAVITFHSVEDRTVKEAFADLAKGCTCPRDFPVCVCGRKPLISFPNRKPLIPSPAEAAANPRSHSAKLRVVEKL